MMAVPSQFYILIAILRANQRKDGRMILSAVEKVRCVRNGGLLYKYNHNNSCTSVWYFWVVQIASSLATYSMVQALSSLYVVSVTARPQAAAALDCHVKYFLWCACVTCSENTHCTLRVCHHSIAQNCGQ